MRSLKFLAVPLAMFAACGGDDDGAGPGDAAGVFPESGFVGRSLQVEVTGDTTSWDSSATVSFGAGVTVSKTEVVSPQALLVDVTIDATAAAGKQDVTVTEGTEAFTLAQAFELKAPFTADVAPNFQQGGFGLITLTNNDLLHPFDVTTDADGNFVNLSVANGDASVGLFVVAATAESATLSAQIDVNATTTGTITFMGLDTDGTTQITTVLDAVPVAARTPVTLTVGTPADFTVTDNGALFEITAADAGLLHMDMTTTDTQNALIPGFILLPASGKFGDFLDQHVNFFGAAALDNRVVAAGDKFYMVALEFAGNPGYQATFNASTVSLTGVTAVTDTGVNDTPAAAQAVTGPVAEFDGTLSTAADQDCFKIAVAANKKLHVFTTDENGQSDTAVAIFAAAADTDPLISSDDADLGEDVVTDAFAAAGTHFVCISTNASSATNAPYKAFAVVE